MTEAPGQAGASEATTVLRLLSPGQAAAATVTVTAVDTGAIATDVRTVPLVADQPLELELAGLPIGEYSVRIEAEAPVVTALWQTTGFGDGIGFRLVSRRRAGRSAEPVRRGAGRGAHAHDHQ